MQDYINIEYILIDGLSTDRTLEIINKYIGKISKIISEKDEGMYDALNKGIQIAAGDVVGMLHADDVFATNDVLSKIALTFKNNSSLDAVIGDVKFLNKEGKPIRYYSSAKWNPERFVWGFMPAHPTFYCKTEHFRTLGHYRLDFEIAADYELLIRFLKIHRLKYSYLPILMVIMETGGKSTRGLKSTFKINKEILIGCKINGIYTNYLMLYLKYFTKVLELGKRKYQAAN